MPDKISDNEKLVRDYLYQIGEEHAGIEHVIQLCKFDPEERKFWVRLALERQGR